MRRMSIENSKLKAWQRGKCKVISKFNILFINFDKRGWIKENPTEGLEFFPVEKKLHYIPPKQDILRVILAADPDTQDYLWTIALTLGRIGKINRLTYKFTHRRKMDLMESFNKGR